MKKRAIKRRTAPLLSHHSKTGKRLSHKFTSYPVLIFILLIVGVFMVSLNHKVAADDVAVNGKVPAPLPTVPAIIVSPTASTHFTSVPITVSGTCQAGDMVKLYRNNVFSGAALCAVGDTFVIQTDLFVGSNDLNARVFNITDDEGPSSPVVTVDYVPPAPPPGTTGNDNQSTGEARAPQFTIDTDNLYKGYFTGDSIEWPLGITGGTAPYSFSVDWGDGKSTKYSLKKAGQLTIKHSYRTEGGYKDSYLIKISAYDANGDTTFLQLVVIVHDKSKIAYAVPGSTSGNGSPPLHLPAMLQLLWPAYFITLLMVSSFWLGERRIFLRLKPAHHGRKTRAV